MIEPSDGGPDQVRAVFGDTAFEHVLPEADGDVLWLVLHRPERLNSMTDLMLREFARIYDSIERGPWRCVLIAGDGRAFCAGADLAQIGDVIDFTDAAQVSDYLDTGWQRVVTRMREVAVPTVSAVHGAAYGGGANLALAADLVVAGESAVFCQSYVDRGISPDLGGTVLLPRLVGSQQARRLLLLGEAIDAAEALRIGMVAEVVADTDLRARARALAAALAAKDQNAVRVTRRLIDENASVDIATGLANEARGVGETLGSPVFKQSADRYAGSAGHAAPTGRGSQTTEPLASVGGNT